MSVDAANAPANALGSVLVFERGGQAYCCPVADVQEIIEEPSLTDAAGQSPLVAGVLLHDGLFIPVVDPACIFDRPPRCEGDVVLMEGHGAVVGLFADRVLGFRQPVSVSPASWVSPGRLCRSAAMLEEIGRAFVLGVDGLVDVPTARRAGAAGETAAEPGPPLHLAYSIAGRGYASAYTDVLRILFRQRMFRIPGGRGAVRHAVEMSGAVVPVLELTDSAAARETSHFVVLASRIGPLALRVDVIDRPVPLAHDGVDPGWFPSPGVAGIGRAGERAIPLVTGDALLRDLIDGEAA